MNKKFFFRTDPIAKWIHKDMNEKIGKWTKIAHTSLIKIIIPLGALPGCAISYYSYFTTDLKGDAFFAYEFSK